MPLDDSFIDNQQAAWQAIVTQMVDQPMFCAINGGSVNGPGSSLRYTQGLRQELPKLLRHYNVTTMLDAPCGDLTWIKQTDLTYLHSYLGFDVDPRIIDVNKKELAQWPQFCFLRTNLLTRKKYPRVDLILSRDFFSHLPNIHIESVINKYRASGSRYLLASNYPGSSNDFVYKPDEYPWIGYLERTHDLTAEPFNLTRIDGIDEQSPPGGVLAHTHELALFDLS